MRSLSAREANFPNVAFSKQGDALKNYKSKEICSIAFKFGQQLKNKKCVCEPFISKYIFFFKSDFGTITPYFVNPFSKMCFNLSLKLNMANCRHVFF